MGDAEVGEDPAQLLHGVVIWQRLLLVELLGPHLNTHKMYILNLHFNLGLGRLDDLLLHGEVEEGQLLLLLQSVPPPVRPPPVRVSHSLGRTTFLSGVLCCTD